MIIVIFIAIILGYVSTGHEEDARGQDCKMTRRTGRCQLDGGQECKRTRRRTGRWQRQLAWAGTSASASSEKPTERSQRRRGSMTWRGQKLREDQDSEIS